MKIHTLKNGFRYIFIEQPVESILGLVLVKVGSRDEQYNYNGLQQAMLNIINSDLKKIGKARCVLIGQDKLFMKYVHSVLHYATIGNYFFNILLFYRL